MLKAGVAIHKPAENKQVFSMKSRNNHQFASDLPEANEQNSSNDYMIAAI